ncbi:MAG: hypothetical protein CMB98_04555 [Flavobacteriaceae bacterium]|nr:hypothetical protein [Flavobacteriaceae bacterium]
MNYLRKKALKIFSINNPDLLKIIKYILPFLFLIPEKHWIIKPHYSNTVNFCFVADKKHGMPMC